MGFEESGGGGGGGGGVEILTLANDNAGTIPQGAAVFISGADSVDLADATAPATGSTIGWVRAAAGIATGATGEVDTTPGAAVQMLCETGLTLAAGEELFQSLVAGRVTNVAPSVAGQHSRSVGRVLDVQTYTGGAEALIEGLYMPGLAVDL